MCMHVCLCICLCFYVCVCCKLVPSFHCVDPRDGAQGVRLAASTFIHPAISTALMFLLCICVLSMYICLGRGCTSCALGCGTWVLHQCLPLLFPALCFLLFEAVFLVAQTGPELCVAYNDLKRLLYICLCVYTCMYRYAHTFIYVEA